MKDKKKLPAITIRMHDSVITHRFEYSDPGVEDWYNALKGLLVGLTYHPISIDKYIMETSEELVSIYTKDDEM